MKKIAFTFNVVGLLIVLPLVAVLQLNHGSKTSPNIEKISIPANENVLSKDDAFSSANNISFKSKF
jgi:hypothetical protein